MEETREQRDKKVIAGYAANLESGRAFTLVAMSARSIIGYQPPASSREYTQALAVLAEGARLGERQAQLVSCVLRKLPALGLDSGQCVARMYDSAAEELASGFYDLMKAASPEPGRRSDNEKQYTLKDRITLAATLHCAARCYLPSGGIGWCLEALIKSEGVRVIAEARPKEAVPA